MEGGASKRILDDSFYPLRIMNAMESFGFLFILFIALTLIMIVSNVVKARKRRDEMSALADRLGLYFSPEEDYEVASRFRFLDALAEGSNRYAFNILSGSYQKCKVMVFDYHYETYSTDSKGDRDTHHHYFSFFILILPSSFPELRITREGFLSKIAQAFGYDDIDFESHEFSRKFCVRSRDKRFAYDICNPRMIEYLLANCDLAIEIEGSALALVFSSRLSPNAIEYNLNRLLEIRARIPDYVF